MFVLEPTKDSVRQPAARVMDRMTQPGRFVMRKNDANRQTRRRFLRFAGTAAAGIGSGNVGGTLGTLWVKAGHEVMFSSLDIEHDRKLAASIGSGARAGTP